MNFFDLLALCRARQAISLTPVSSIAMAEIQHSMGTTAPLEGKNTYAIGFGFVLMAGFCWSLGGLLFRLISDANVWQVLFYRSVVLALTLVVVIASTNKGHLVGILRNAGYTGVIAGFCVALSSLTFIFSLTFTTVASASFMVGSVPFFSALLGWVLLRERVSLALALAIAVAFCGIGLMVVNGISDGQIIGNLLALYAALSFACFTVLLRWNGKTDTTPAVFWVVFCLHCFAFPFWFFQMRSMQVQVLQHLL
ncbi:MAG: DMT family transporter [Hyphomicrobiales bacterium]